MPPVGNCLRHTAIHNRKSVQQQPHTRQRPLKAAVTIPVYLSVCYRAACHHSPIYPYNAPAPQQTPLGIVLRGVVPLIEPQRPVCHGLHDRRSLLHQCFVLHVAVVGKGRGKGIGKQLWLVEHMQVEVNANLPQMVLRT